jgi:hypothetical protein
MNIFGHLIPDGAILGIGPLIMASHPTHEEELVYNTRRYFFDLHLVNHTTAVKSDWFRPRDNAEEMEKMRTWKEEYFKIRDKISEMAGEPTDSRLQHVKHAEELHFKITKNFTDLLEQMQPLQSDAVEGIHARIERVLSEVEDLKKLAIL